MNISENQMSEANRRSSASVTPWLIGGVLLLATAGLVIACVPLVECPDDHMFLITYTHDDGTGKMVTNTAAVSTRPTSGYFACSYCGGTRRTTLFRKWTHRTAEAR